MEDVYKRQAVTQLIGKGIVCFHLHEAGHLENYLFQREIGAFQNGSIPAGQQLRILIDSGVKQR